MDTLGSMLEVFEDYARGGYRARLLIQVTYGFVKDRGTVVARVNFSGMVAEAFAPTQPEAVARVLTMAAIQWRQMHENSHGHTAGSEKPPQLSPSSPNVEIVKACYLCGGQHEKSLCPNVPK